MSSATRRTGLRAAALLLLVGACAPRAEAPGEHLRADSLYRAGRTHLARREYRPAADSLASVSARFPRSELAADARYWRAMALYGVGDVAALRQALTELGAPAEAVPRGTSPGAVRLLAARACRRLAKLDEDAARATAACAPAAQLPAGQPCTGSTADEERLALLAAAVATHPERAWPRLREFALDPACTSELRRGALLLVADYPRETALPVLVRASGDPGERVGLRAISLLAEVDDGSAAARLAELATASPNPRIRGRALAALGENPAPESRARLRALASGGSGAGRLQSEAIEVLADNLRDGADLADARRLFAQLPPERKGELLRALGPRADAGTREWILAIASGARHPDAVRRDALRSLAEDGDGIAALIRYYDEPEAAPMRGVLLRIYASEGGEPGLQKLRSVMEGDASEELRRTAARLLRSETAQEDEVDEDGGGNVTRDTTDVVMPLPHRCHA